MELQRKKNILIVDDDPFMQSLYRKPLEREGFEILTAVDGQAAVDMLPTLAADLIVLDLMLPKVHGLKVLEAIRADKVHKNLPVLIVSNAYLPEIAERAMEAGATAGILKSECSPKRLVKIIHKILEAPAEPAGKQPAARQSWISNLLGNQAETQRPEAVNAKPEAVVTSDESVVLTEVQGELLKSWQSDISMIRELCLKYVKAVGSQKSEDHLRTLYRRLRLLSARATMGKYFKISKLCNALEAMLFENGFNLRQNMSPSVVQTMVQAVDCLEHLFKTGRLGTVHDDRRIRVLLVDDDPVCNLVNDTALKRANFETVCANDGVEGLAQLENSSFDLVFLDINMPVLSGFEVCEKIRKLPKCKDIPVIFVTLLGDFQTRAQSVLSGSNGLIAKPISPLELIVKALVFLLRADGKELAKEAPVALKPATDNVANGLPPQLPAASPSGSEERTKEFQATQAAVEDKVQALTQALAEETKRRELAERQVVADAKLQSKLEEAKAKNQQAHEWLGRLLEESHEQAQNGDASQAWKLAGRTRALEAVRSFVETKGQTLTKVLAVETKRFESTKQEFAKFAKRRSELEAALAAIQQAKENLLREIELGGNGKSRVELEAALAENQNTQTSLLQQMEATLQEFQTQQQGQANRPSPKEAPGQELEAARAALAELKNQHSSVTAQVQSLTESLAAEASRRTAAEQQAEELAARRAELEQELSQRSQTQEQLRAELDAHEQLLEEQIHTHDAEAGHLAERTKELEAAQAALADLKHQYASTTVQIRLLNESLVAEANHRTTAQQAVAELSARRAELEQELAQRSKSHEQLLAQLIAQQALLDAQVQSHNVELGHLAERTKELESAQAELADLKNQHASVTAQVQSLSESLTAEASRRAKAEQTATDLAARRAELEQELALRAQNQEQLSAQLVEQQQRLDSQVQVYHVELGNLAQRTKELETAQAALAELKNQHAKVTAQTRSLDESLATEASRRANAEQTAAALAARRAELEEELALRSHNQEQLSAQLAEQQQRLNSQVQVYHVELGNLAQRTKELETAQAALAELKRQHASVTALAQSLTESLTNEASRRTTAEQAASDLAARRAELEQELARRSQNQEQLSAQLAEQQQRLDSQVQVYNVELGNLAQRTKELETAQAALAELRRQHTSVSAQVQSLTKSLKAEAGRRNAAEQEIGELNARRAALEQELARRSEAHEQSQADLAEQQQRLQVHDQAHDADRVMLATRTRELEASQARLADLKNLHAGVTAQVQSLTESLTSEASLRTTAEQQVAELAARRNELEQELAKRSQHQEQLSAQLAEHQQRLDSQVQDYHVELGNLAQRTKELETAQAALTELKRQHASVTALAQSLTESLTNEASRRTTAEQEIGELTASRAALEQELARRSDAQLQLQAQLAEQQQRLQVHDQAHDADRVMLATRTRELEASQARLADLKNLHAGVTAQVQSLTESLTSEASLRTTAEQQVAELAARRNELEQELAKRSQHQEQLSAQLAEHQQRLDSQVQDYHVELGNLAQRTKELETAQAALTELKRQHASVTALAQSLTESLTNEASRRTTAEQEIGELTASRAALEQELARRSDAQLQLQAQLAEQQQRLQVQVQTHHADCGQLALRSQELEASQAVMADLRNLHAGVMAQVQSLTESLTNESSRRATAEQLAAGLAARRAELEQELALRAQNQEQFRAELTRQQQRLDAQVQSYHVELDNLAKRTRELAVAQSALAELKNQHTGVTEQVQSLTESLTNESSRRKNAEEQAADLAARRAELEQELAKRSQHQEQLSAQLAEHQQRLQVQVQAHHADRGELALRTQELEASQAALADLRHLHVGVIAQVLSLTESLTNEASRRTIAEQEIRELTARRAALEQELARRAEAQRQLQAQFSEQQHGLEVQVQAHHADRGELALRTQELEASQAALADMRHLHAGVLAQVQSLTESLHQESSRRTTAEQQAAALTARRAALETELARGAQAHEQLSSELVEKQQRVEMVSADLADARSQAAAEILRRKQMVAQMAEQGEVTAKAVAKWQAKAAHAENALEQARRELAGLRYSFLDASRLSARLHRERSQQERQNLNAMRQSLASLAQTPLSLAQRGVLSDLQNSCEGLKPNRPGATKIAAFRVETPDLREREFSLAELIESAFSAIRAAAEVAGVAMQCTTSGVISGKLIGNAEHLHQLITLLAAPPLTLVTGVNTLDLRVSIETKYARRAALSLRVGLFLDNPVEELLVRLNSVAAAAATLQTGEFSETEFGLAAGWELARAMGAQAKIESAGNNQVWLLLSLPITKAATIILSDNEATPMVSSHGKGQGNGNGNGNGHANGHANGSHNGYRMTHPQPSSNPLIQQSKPMPQSWKTLQSQHLAHSSSLPAPQNEPISG